MGKVGIGKAAVIACALCLALPATASATPQFYINHVLLTGGSESAIAWG